MAPLSQSSRRSASSKCTSARSEASVCSRTSGASRGSKTSRTSRSSTRPSARRDGVLDHLADTLNSEANERFGTMGNALKGLATDAQGNVSRGEMRRLFEELGQSRQTADQCFDTMSDRGSVDMRSLKGVLDKPQQSRRSSRSGSEAVPADPSSPALVSLASTSPATARQRSPSAPLTPPYGVTPGIAGYKRSVSQDGSEDQQEPDDPNNSNAEDATLKNISPQLSRNLRLLGPALGRKFGTIRRAFRVVDTDHSGAVSREETREFFRNFGFLDPAPADEFFDAMDADGGGIVDYREFQKVFAPYIYGTASLGTSCLPMKPRERPLTSSRSTPNLSRSEGSSTPRRKLNDGDLSKIVGQVSELMTSKYGTVRKAFKGVAENHDSTLSREDVRGFFRNYGFSNVADQFFDRFDSGGKGRINYRDFQAHFARHVEPTHHIAKRNNDRFSGENADIFDGQTTYRSSYSPAKAQQ